MVLVLFSEPDDYVSVMSLLDNKVHSRNPFCEFSFSPVQNLSEPDRSFSSSLFTSSTVEDHGEVTTLWRYTNLLIIIIIIIIMDSCMAEYSDDSSSPPPFSSPWRETETPSNNTGRFFWDSAIGTSLTPVASSTMAPGAPRRSSYRGSGLLPIPFVYDDSEKMDIDDSAEEATGDLPTTPPAELSSASDHCTVTTPLGRSLLSLNISQTPKSLVRRRAAVSSREKAYRVKIASSRNRRPPATRVGGGLSRPSQDPHGPQTNVNPFVTAAIGSSVARHDSSSFTCGINSSPQ